MTETSQTEKLKRYIFDEMDETERENLDGRFFEDSDLFYEYVELKNDLTDLYARNLLKGEDLKRFERSLAKMPAGREKIAIARTLQTLADEEREKVPVPVIAPTLWQRIANFFTLKLSAVQYATAAIVILLVGVGGFLIYREQQRREYAEIEKRNEAERIEKENRLRELEEQQRRFEEERRRNQLDQELPNSNIVNNQTPNVSTQPLDNKNNTDEEKGKKEIERLKQEIEDADRKSIRPPTRKIQPVNPIITTILKLSVRGTRGGEDDIIIKISQATKQISVTLELPEGLVGDSFDVKLNDGNLPTKVKPRIAADGKRFLSVTIPSQKLKDNKNTISVGNYESNFFIERE